MRACMRARMIEEHGTPPEHDQTRNTRPPEKGGTRAKHKNKICYYGENYTQKMKKVKKNLEI